MSLSSILRSRFPSIITSCWSSSRLSVQRPALAAVNAQSPSLIIISSPPHQQKTTRSSGSWIEVVRQVPSDDPNKVGELTFEDRDLSDVRMLRAQRAETPLRRRPNFARHEKAWMRRKRLKMEKRYNRLQDGVNELKAFIQFKQDNKPDW